MTRVLLPFAGFALAVVAAASAGLETATPVAAAAGGTIKGRIRVSGTIPGNRVIRMGMDPMCAIKNAGKRPVNEVVVTSDDGGLANAFVKLDGSFPPTPVPTESVVLDQNACFYRPRVVGARVGQLLRVTNSDNLLHNVHSDSSKRNSFNKSEPQAGMHVDFTLKDEEMLRIGCDVHRWMTAWVGVVAHPYFAVSGGDGTFTISHIPAGRRTITAWHELFGAQTKMVDVKDGGTTTVAFVYAGDTQKP